MKYNFDMVIDRTNSNSVKWDDVRRDSENSDIIPMWVADMDFISPQEVIEALGKRVEHGVFGYPAVTEQYKQVIVDWMKGRHDWDIEKDWIKPAPGVIPSINWLIEAFSKPGDKVIIQTPVYTPFYTVVENIGRHAVLNPLKLEDGRYIMDFDDLEEKARDPWVKLLVLSNPHNPVGRVWERKELEKLGEICLRNGVMVISDEIHSDLIFKNHRHIPFAAVSDELAQISAICNAPSKTFNIAGLQTSNIIIPNASIRKEFSRTMQRSHIGIPNLLGLTACEAAYRYGSEWLEQVMEYIESNYNFLSEFIRERIPQLIVAKTEGTYLAWIDCRSLGLNHKELEKFLKEKARVQFTQGYIFGEEGNGFIRMNFACARPVLKEALSRMESAIRQLTA